MAGISFLNLQILVRLSEVEIKSLCHFVTSSLDRENQHGFYPPLVVDTSIPMVLKIWTFSYLVSTTFKGV
jgi:hypothetical protein